jgi:hypothetical protein
MPSNIQFTEIARNAAANAVCKLCHCLYVYDGKQPAYPGQFVRQGHLVRLDFRFPPFDIALDGHATGYLLEGVAVATGKAAWFRVSDRDGMALFDGSIGLRDCAINLDRLDIAEGDRVNIARMTYVQPMNED